MIEIIIETNDQTGGALGNIQKGLLAMDKVVQRMQNKLRAFALQKFAATVRLIDRVTQPGSRINSFLKNLAAKVYTISMRVNDSVGNKIRQIESSLMRLAGKAWTVAINVRDNVTSKVKGLTDGLLMGMGGMIGCRSFFCPKLQSTYSYTTVAFQLHYSRRLWYSSGWQIEPKLLARMICRLLQKQSQKRIDPRFYSRLRVQSQTEAGNQKRS